MANRRMFSQRVTGDEKFLEMPVSAQNLYFHLGIYADDDGFVNPQKIIRIVGSNPDDLKVLLAKNFVIPFETGVIVITHWKENNYIRNDRYIETIYKEQKDLLKEKDGVYSLGIPNGYQMDTQVRLGKVRLGKVRLELDKSNLPDWLDKEIWNSWVLYRKEKKQTLTQRSIDLQLKELEKNKDTHREIIEQSIKNGWTGLFPLKNKDTKTNILKADSSKYKKYDNK
jgi:hypothetical protein